MAAAPTRSPRSAAPALSSAGDQDPAQPPRPGEALDSRRKPLAPAPTEAWSAEVERIWQGWAEFCGFTPTMRSAQREMWGQLVERGFAGALMVESQLIMERGREAWKSPEHILNLNLREHRKLLDGGVRSPALAPRQRQLTPGLLPGTLVLVRGVQPEPLWAQVIALSAHLRILEPCGPGAPLHLDARQSRRWAQQTFAPGAARPEALQEELNQLAQARSAWIDAQVQARRTRRAPVAPAQANPAPGGRGEAPKTPPGQGTARKGAASASPEARKREQAPRDPALRLRLQHAGYLPGAAPDQGGAPQWLAHLHLHDPEATLRTRKTAPRWCVLEGAVRDDAERCRRAQLASALARLR